MIGAYMDLGWRLMLINTGFRREHLGSFGFGAIALIYIEAQVIQCPWTFTYDAIAIIINLMVSFSIKYWLMMGRIVHRISCTALLVLFEMIERFKV
jgi:hypothetical protein